MADEGVQCDSCVTDPPYHMQATLKRFANVPRNGKTVGKAQYGRLAKGFMGQMWDGGDVAFRSETWTTVAAIMRPGAFLVAFGGTRTYHRLVCAIEDAGFVIQDQIAWIYGTGFPKNKSTLKPAIEPICLAYKSGDDRTLNTEECRIGADGGTARIHQAPYPKRLDGGEDRSQSWARTGHEAIDLGTGRWPANVVHDGSAEVLELFPNTGEGSYPAARGRGGIATNGHSGQVDLETSRTNAGNAARFFYTAKADVDDRQKSGHPTVKPVELMRWLVRLVTPEGGLVLDPFAGSGSTGAAAMLEGVDSILIEREASYVKDIERKLAHFRNRRVRTLY